MRADGFWAALPGMIAALLFAGLILYCVCMRAAGRPLFFFRPMPAHPPLIPPRVASAA